MFAPTSLKKLRLALVANDIKQQILLTQMLRMLVANPYKQFVQILVAYITVTFRKPQPLPTKIIFLYGGTLRHHLLYLHFI